MNKIAISLGSNMGDRHTQLTLAAKNLQGLQGLSANLIASDIIETPALLPQGAAKEWDMPYLNQVIVMQVYEPFLSNPELLLQSIKIIESELGRIERGKWSPREIDIDIIAIEGLNWASETLEIPHPLAHERYFVLQPLCTIWADAILANGLSAFENMARLELAMQGIWGAQA